MNIREIRDAFEHCRIFVSPSEITLGFYEFNDGGHITVSPTDHTLFDYLVEKSESISVTLYPRNHAHFTFNLDTGFQSERWFDEVLTESELLERIDQEIANNNTLDVNFVRAFQNVDPNDSNAIMKGWAEFLDSKKNKNEVNLNGIINWNRLRKAARRFYESSGFLEYDEEDPGGFCDFGVASFYTEVKMYSEFHIAGVDLDLFKDLIRVSDGFGITVYNGDDLMAFNLEVNS